ncbi:MAG: tetratricopeptide repeat protein [Sulfurimonas sp.]|jgi:TolA-binding protein|nr:tetratricopeptide repeat protein [Sulfurimonas sp.]
MNRIFLVVLFATIVPFNLISAEPSAFGAGNLETSEPYGLSSSEKAILQNKDKLKKVLVKSNNQANEVDSLRERIDGLQTIIEGLSRKAQENKLTLKNLDEKNRQELISSNEYEKRLGEISQVNALEIKDMKLAVAELTALLNIVNSDYVTKDEFNTLVSDFNKFKELVAKELKNSPAPVPSKISNAEMAKLAKQNYDKKYYTKSIDYYTKLIENNYKPAYAHYMIGEMKYKRKNYSDAIAYFKKSASLYSKASYMPVLMLHTAVSMEETGDIKNAKIFYKGIVSKYSNSEHAQTAKNRLSKLK